MRTLLKRVVISVVTYENLSAVQKVVFPNGITIDIFPAVQEMIFSHRQISGLSTEAGGMLVGYENAQTGNFTLANATEPQPSDVRTRISLVLRYQHKEQLRKLQEPYGYIGTWHTHPSATPSPSPVDLRDWEKCIRKNQNCTSALVFIIAGTETYRVWLCDSRSGKIIEGSLL